MSTDKISIAVVEDFVKKVRLAAKSNQKEIKLTINDAENLAFNLNLVILKLLDKIQTAEVETSKEEIIRIAMDGGSL